MERESGFKKLPSIRVVRSLPNLKKDPLIARKRDEARVSIFEFGLPNQKKATNKRKSH